MNLTSQWHIQAVKARCAISLTAFAVLVAAVSQVAP